MGRGLENIQRCYDGDWQLFASAQVTRDAASVILEELTMTSRIQIPKTFESVSFNELNLGNFFLSKPGPTLILEGHSPAEFSSNPEKKIKKNPEDLD